MIEVEIFCDNPNLANTYLVKKDGHGLIIDPANNIKTLDKFVGNLIVDGVLLTHGHYDHFKTLEETLLKYDVKCYLHKEAIKKIFNLELSFASAFGETNIPKISLEKFVTINSEKEMNIGKFNVKTILTPGHTNCSVLYIIDYMMFSGDTLFKNSIGRMDLLTGNAIAMKNSLDKIKKMKTNYIVYPGHDQSTNLFTELKNNYYLK